MRQLITASLILLVTATNVSIYSASVLFNPNQGVTLTYD